MRPVGGRPAPGDASMRQDADPPRYGAGQHGSPGRPLHQVAAPDGAGPSAIRPHLDHRSARAARRHSIFVAVMKGMLPSLVISFIVGAILYAQGVFDPPDPDAPFVAPRLDLSGSGVTMVSPRLTGLDRNNQRFEVTAETAVQHADDPGMVTMERIRGRMELQDGGWFGLEAAGGVYDSDANVLELTDDIEVTLSSGYVARLNTARVDFQEGRVDTENPVLVFMNAGIITGNAMTMLEKGRRVRFTDGATMTINGRAGSSAEAR